MTCPDAKRQVATRRRGRQLEQAIFAAVLEELAETGYTRLTIEGVAARARTSRPVLYRRWPSRAALVLAALVGGMPRIDDLPDTGELRSDVITLLRTAACRFAGIDQEVLCGLIAETSRDPELAATVRSTVLHGQEMMSVILDRAATRGEIASRPGPRVATLPPVLLCHNLLLYGTIDEGTIADLVDEVFLPLVQA